MKQITYSQPDQSPLFRPILRFSIPLMLTGLLQLAYNTVDSVVVGRYAGSTSLAAVGATTSIIFLLVTLFNGVSIGTNYLTARYYGAGDQEAISQTVHCSAVLSVILGLMAGVVGILFSTPLLELAGAPMDVLPLSSLYLKIYFLGIPALVAYNFGSAILRAVGDTLYPLIFMIVSGAMTVGLGLVMCVLLRLFQTQLLGIYVKPADDAYEAVMAAGVTRVLAISQFQWIGGMMETACGSIRGLGKTINPTVTTLIGACGLRVIWLYTIFKAVGTIESLYWSYPVSWTLTLVIHIVFLLIYKRQLEALQKGENACAPPV